MNATHLGTYGIVQKEGKILLIRKARGPYTGKLDLPGGKLEHGESVLEGLARELYEETGITLQTALFFENATTVVHFTDDRGDVSMYHVGLIYEVTAFSGDGILHTAFEDSLGSGWHDIATLAEHDLSPFAARAVHALTLASR